MSILDPTHSALSVIRFLTKSRIIGRPHVFKALCLAKRVVSTGFPLFASMTKPDFHHSKLQHIAKRAILPLLPSDPLFSQKPSHELPDPQNTQGDIYLLFPKVSFAFTLLYIVS